MMDHPRSRDSHRTSSKRNERRKRTDRQGARKQFFSPQIERLEDRAMMAAFTPGNIVLYRVGTGGVTDLVNTGNAVFLDEYSSAGSLVQSVAMPTAVSGANKQLIASGIGTLEGQLTRSADGRYLMSAGYATNTGGGSALAGTTSASVPRTIGRVSSTGTVDTSMAVTDFSSGGSPISVASDTGAEVWLTGGAGGLRYSAFTVGNTTSTQILSSPANYRQVGIAGGSLYAVTNAAGTKVGRVGAAGTLPTSGAAYSSLAGTTSLLSPNGFVFFDLDPAIGGVDTLYVADDGASAVTKYRLVSGTWTASGSVGADSDDYRGISGRVTSAGVQLFATRKGGSGTTGGGELVSILDTAPAGTLSATPTLLATAANRTAFRGVALAPSTVVPTVSSIVRVDPSPSAASSVRFTVTFSENVSGVDISDFALNGSAVATASLTSVAKVNASTYTVTVAAGFLTGTLGIEVSDNDSITSETSAIALGGTGTSNGNYTAGETYLMETGANVSSIALVGASPTNASSVDYLVTFDRSVTGVDPLDFALTSTGTIAGASVTGVSGSGSTRTVTVNSGTGDGTLRLDVLDNNTILDSNLQPSASGKTDGPTYTFDRTAPVATAVKLAGQTSTAVAGPIKFAVSFTEPVADFDISDLTINAAGSPTASIVGSGTDYVVFVSGMTAGTVTLRVNANSVHDAVGNANTAASGTATVTYSPAPLYINELFYNPGGTDSPNEYFEIQGTPGGTVPNGVYLIALEGDASSNRGDVQTIFNLSGLSLGTSGYLVVRQDGNSYSTLAGANVITGSTSGFAGAGIFSADSTTDIENGSASFLLIQTAITPSLSDDIDTDDDGTADTAVWTGWTTVDGIGVLDASVAGDFGYSPLNFADSGGGGAAPSGSVTSTTGFTAGYVARRGTGATSGSWVAGNMPTNEAPIWSLDTGTTTPAVYATKLLTNIGGANFPAPNINLPANPVGDEDVFFPISGISIADADDVNSQVTLSVSLGTITLNGTAGLSFTAGDGVADATHTFTGTLSAINAALNGLSYARPLHEYGTDTLNISVNDGILTDTDSLLLTLNPVNDAPVHTLPAPPTTLEDTPFALPGISVADVDVGISPLLVTLIPTGGTVSTVASGGAVLGGSSTTLTITGTMVDVNLTLANLQFSPNADHNDAIGPSSLVVHTSDLGNSGSGGALTDEDTLVVNVSPVNDAPVHTLPTLPSTQEDTPFLLSGISIADIDVGVATVLVTLTPSGGTVGATASGSAVLGGGPTSFTITGSTLDVNATLSSLMFSPALDRNDTVGPTSLVVHTSDLGGFGLGGALTDEDTIAIAVSPVNDAPVHTLPAPPTTLEDTPFALPGISVADVDVGISPLLVTLIPTGGTVSTVASGGAVLGGSSTTLTITGTMVDVNLTLANLQFSPNAHHNDAIGPSRLVVRTSDLGSFGSGGALIDQDTLAISITPVNDAPTYTAGPASIHVLEDVGNYANWATNMMRGPLAATDEPPQNLTFTVTELADPDGIFNGATLNSATGLLHFNLAMNRYSENGLGVFRVVLNDNGGISNGGVDTALLTATVTVTVDAVNDRPIFLDSTYIVPKNMTTGTILGVVTPATDIPYKEDDVSTPVRPLTYMLVGGVGNATSVFDFDPDPYVLQLKVKNSALMVQGTTYTLTLRTTDSGRENGDLTDGVTQTGDLAPLSDDCTVLIEVTAPVDIEFGDAPATYGTDTALHAISVGPLLGQAIDYEATPVKNASATGDDASNGGNSIDDEEGVVVTNSSGTPVNTLAIGSTYTFTINLTNVPGAGSAFAWLDLNGDGDFGSGTVLGPFTHDVASSGLSESMSLSPGNTGRPGFRTDDGSFTFTFTPTAEILNDTGGRLIARFRSSSVNLLTPLNGSFDGETEDYSFPISSVDFGDAPASYGTEYTAHIFGGPRLGATFDAEAVAAISANADGDGADEDGVTIPQLALGRVATFTVDVQNLTPLTGSARVQLWMDTNKDGVFAAGDDTFAPYLVTGNASGRATATFVYNPTTAGTLFARFRVSSAGGLSAQGNATNNSIAPSGEMEDYRLQVLNTDYSDAPAQTISGIPFAYGTASHLITGSRIAVVNAEIGPTTNDPLAEGDDSDDGVTISSVLRAGTQYNFNTVVAGASANTRLQVWADLNADGDFGDSGELVYSQFVSNGTIPVPFTPTAAMFRNQAFAMLRFRVSDSATALSPTGAATSGEVEDYKLTLADSYDYGDLSASGPSYNSASHRILGVTLGTAIDAEPGTSASSQADGDDVLDDTPTIVANVDDEDGLSWSTVVIGSTLTFTVNVRNLPTGHIARVNAFIDWNHDGDFGDTVDGTSERVYDAAQTANGTFTFTVLPTAAKGIASGGTLSTRIRIASAAGAAPAAMSASGVIDNGEVEDYSISIRSTDFGDLAAAPGITDNFATLDTTHGRPGGTGLAAGPQLGLTVDSESTVVPNFTATTDGSDEDGLIIPNLAVGVNTLATVTVNNVNGATKLGGWIDFNNDGDFTDAGEQVLNRNITGSGNYSFSFAPSVAMASFSYGLAARFRVTSDSTLGPTGPASNGEVEDYRLQILTDAGDAWPEGGSGYDTANTGHAINGPRLGDTVDGDPLTLQGTTFGFGGPKSTRVAIFDDNNGGDEDGLSLNNGNPLVIGTTYTATVNVQNVGTSVAMRTWADYNGDGDFNDASELVYGIQVTAVGGSSERIFTFPLTPTLAWAKNPYLRIRVAESDVLLGPTGFVSTGEMEDYWLNFNLDMGDAPESYGLVGHGAAGPMLGSLKDLDSNTNYSADSQGDDNDYVDDEDALAAGTTFTVGEPTTLSLSVSNVTAASKLFAWLDLDGDGSYSSGEQLAAKSLSAGATSTQFVFTPTLEQYRSSGGVMSARFRIVQGANSLTPSGFATNGEVEDYRIPFNVVKDYGDAPEISITLNPTYGTASHVAAGATLGEKIDIEPETQSTDDTVDIDDEDGLTGPAGDVVNSNLFENATVTFTLNVRNIPAGRQALVKAWLDINGNGSFENSGEEVLNTVRSTNGTFTFTVNPTSAQRNSFTGLSQLRVRVVDFQGANPPTLRSTDALQGGGSSRGEVEDYPVYIKQNADIVISRQTSFIEVRDKSGTADDDLRVVIEGDYMKITALPVTSNPSPIIIVSGITGAIGSGTSVVRLPLTQLNQKLRIDTKAGSDRVTLDAVGGDYIVPSGLDVTLGSNTDFDTLRLAGETTNIWSHTSALGGTVAVSGYGTLSYGGTEELQGGSGNDLFKLKSTAAAGLTVDGNGGNDTLEVQANTNFVLGDGQLDLADGRSFLLADLETANLTGGIGSNTFDVSGWTRGGTLTSGGGTDTVKKHFAPLDSTSTFFLSPTYLATSDVMIMNLSGILNADLKDTGVNTSAKFVANEWYRAAKFDGGSGTDELSITRNFSTATLSDTSFTSGTNKPILLANIEKADITGGKTKQTASFGDWSGQVTFDGAGDVDTVSVSHNTANFDANDDKIIHGSRTVNLENVEAFSLTGGAANNTFDVSDWSGSGKIYGQGGVDRLVVDHSAPKYLKADFLLSDKALTHTVKIGSVVNTQTIQLAGVEDAELVAGGVVNNFNLNGWTGNADIDLGAGFDSFSPGDDSIDVVTISRDADMKVDGDTLTIGGKTIKIRHIGYDPLGKQDVLNLSGGASANKFTFIDWFGDLTLAGGAGIDTLTVQGSRNYTLSDTLLIMSYLLGGDAVVSTAFGLSSFEIANLIGGADNNGFELNGFSGTGSINGNGGDDWLAVFSDSDMILDAALLTLGGKAFTLANLESAYLQGLGGDTRFEIKKWSKELTVFGEGGSDTIITQADANFTLNQASLLRSDLPAAWSIGDLESAELTGGTGNNTFTIGDWTGTGKLAAGGGTDRLVVTRNADMTLYDADFKIYSANGKQPFTISSFEVAELTGGGGNNFLDASHFNGIAILSGAAGNDVLWGGAKNDVLNGDGGDDVLVGNGGKDMLYGGLGRDLLIGGGNVDSLSGEGEDDIVIGGSTKYDSNKAALDAILASWTSTNAYVDRVTKLRDDGVGPTKSYLLNAVNVIDDGLTDTLIGGTDLDWFLLELTTGQPGVENPNDDLGTEVLTDLN